MIEMIFFWVVIAAGGAALIGGALVRPSSPTSLSHNRCYVAGVCWSIAAVAAAAASPPVAQITNLLLVLLLATAATAANSVVRLLERSSNETPLDVRFESFEESVSQPVAVVPTSTKSAKRPPAIKPPSPPGGDDTRWPKV